MIDSSPIRRAAKALILTLAMFTGQAGAVTSDPVRSVDNIPPTPATDIRALSTATSVLITWTASEDDASGFAPFGDVFVPTGGLNGYRVYRTPQGGDEELIGSTAPGTTQFTDAGAQSGLTYIYTVRPFDADNETDPAIAPGSAEDLARIVALGGEPPDVVVVKRVKARMTIDVELDLADVAAVAAFSDNFISVLASRLGIDASRISITAITQGSTIVQFEILDVEGAEGPTAEDALADLLVLAADDTQDAFASIGPVLSAVDESSEVVVVIPQPVDVDGDPILGWFSRQGTQVGFDDFFLFADHFGTKTGGAGFDEAFDIVSNGTVDFDDFFRFADDFGKTVANAAEIQALLHN